MPRPGTAHEMPTGAVHVQEPDATVEAQRLRASGDEKRRILAVCPRQLVVMVMMMMVMMMMMMVMMTMMMMMVMMMMMTCHDACFWSKLASLSSTKTSFPKLLFFEACQPHHPPEGDDHPPKGDFHPSNEKHGT